MGAWAVTWVWMCAVGVALCLTAGRTVTLMCVTLMAAGALLAFGASWLVTAEAGWIALCCCGAAVMGLGRAGRVEGLRWGLAGVAAGLAVALFTASGLAWWMAVAVTLAGCGAGVLLLVRNKVALARLDHALLGAGVGGVVVFVVVELLRLWPREISVPAITKQADGLSVVPWWTIAILITALLAGVILGRCKS